LKSKITGTTIEEPVKIYEKNDNNEKYKKLIEWFEIKFKDKKNRVLIALSGGVDSAVVAMVAKNALGKNNVLAVTANYQTLSKEELNTAVKVAHELDINHKIIEYNELENPEYIKNDSSRCFHCRNELADNLIKIANNENFKSIVDGSNTDDLNDYRPGMIALHEKGIKSPLIETGFNKKDIRNLARVNNLSVYDKPSNACLASRISKNIEITPTKLKRIENCELLIKEIFKVKQVRVRDHGDLARIEVEKEELTKLFDLDKLGQIEIPFKEYGFKHVTIDIEGYRKSGLISSDKIVNLTKKQQTSNNDNKQKEKQQ
jgi:pyridinium-3,5-biscarboxylic acid mononucleotide sulfurtransferase